VFKRSQGYFKMGRMSNSPSPIPVELPTMDNGSTRNLTLAVLFYELFQRMLRFFPLQPDLGVGSVTGN
jgi:hypothetical protein